ncbi:MAG: hypothetical protein M1114_06195 [Candidatus Dependentiae bacterium]|nr:hypothetical protein [Candidatus Dependentiae bacterium]
MAIGLSKARKKGAVCAVPFTLLNFCHRYYYFHSSAIRRNLHVKTIFCRYLPSH